MSENRQNPTDDQPLRDAIRDRLAALCDTGAVIVRYSIVAEVVTDDEDSPWLWTCSDEVAKSLGSSRPGPGADAARRARPGRRVAGR